MKKAFTMLCLAGFILALSVGAFAQDFDVDTDYMSLMLDAAVCGDWETGTNAQFSRDAKIDALESGHVKVTFEDLYLTAKIIYVEAGSAWIPEEWKLSVGEVVLNRVASSEFPNTVSEVVYQSGQYYGSGSGYFAAINPDAQCAQLALRLLEGERVLGDPSVVFQSNFRQGSGVFVSYYDEALGWTYFCVSNRPHLYEV